MFSCMGAVSNVAQMLPFARMSAATSSTLLPPIILATLLLVGAQQFSSVVDAKDTTTAVNQQLQAFLGHVEQLVLETTERALIVTRNVYLNISQEMPPTLLHATNQTMMEYVQRVDAALLPQSTANYTEKHRLLRQFKANNLQIEQLRRQLTPLQPEFNFQLISDDFYNSGRNSTEFDNLYLEFMGEFARASQKLWDVLSEQTVEEQQELLEILDEIANETRLREKDKLYDEFIEMYLFKDHESELQNRELLY